MKTNLPFLAGCILVLSFALLANGATIQDLPEGDPVRGAQLYDAWYNVVNEGRAPEGNHPLWATQTSNLRTGAVTWRCVTCHGWDYKGADGAFGPDSAEFTGFPGVINSVGASNAEILAWLNGQRNPDHDYSQYLSPGVESDLVVFLRTRLIDTDLLVANQTGLALGSVSTGQDLYNQNCEECHGGDGALMNLNTGLSPEFLGDIAVRNPYLFIHKARFSQPGARMPAMEREGWTLQQVADVLSFAQTLPMAQPITEEELNPTPFTLDFSQQGDTTGIIIGAIVILLVIFGGVVLVQVGRNLEEND
jgi:thiosulfate dehydrogenase